MYNSSYLVSSPILSETLEVCESNMLLNTNEYKRIIFNAAKDGKLYRLKCFLEQKPKKEVEVFVSARTNGATPLIMACRNGHLDVVKYLIRYWDASIEQVGSVSFDDETIENVSPLWCAAAGGHLNIVKTLISHNAAVNCMTKTNSTPLRAACFDGHFEIAKYLIQHGADIEIANRRGHTSLMIACFKGHYDVSKLLIDCGADINRKSFKGNTALHDCAESGSLQILKMLLKHGAKIDKDSSGTTPLLSAAVTGHATIVEYFIYEHNCTKEEKINALELLGATFMDKKRDMHAALEYWKRAMVLRYENSEYPVEKPYEKSPIACYIDTTEVRTLDQLSELINDPDEMRMQALLIRERILGPAHPDTVYYIRYRGAAFADNGNFGRCIQLWMYALDVHTQRVQEPLNPMTQSSLLAFTELFSYMMSEARGGLPNNLSAVSFFHVLHVFKRAVTEIETALKASQDQDLTHTNQFHRTLIIAMHLIGLMCKLQPTLDCSEEMSLKKTVCHFVHLNPKAKNGFSPLHLASCIDSKAGRYPVFTFPSPEVVKLLLEVGSCPNALDGHNNTPLHVAALNNKACAKTIFKSLLDHGAHLDVRNSDNQTPLQLANITAVLDICPLQYINLQCLCAQAINSHKISYNGLVHKKLSAFLDFHCAQL